VVALQVQVEALRLQSVQVAETQVALVAALRLQSVQVAETQVAPVAALQVL
jgi:hypothetical protein